MINMVATYAWGAGAGVVHSAAAKAGVLSLTRTLAVEWGKKYGIRVNAIAPGPIEKTGGADRLWVSEEAAKRTIESVPLEDYQEHQKKLLIYFSSSFLKNHLISMVKSLQWMAANG